MSDPKSHGQMMNYLVRNSEDKKRMREYFETNQITTASNINRPREPKLTQIFQDFNERNPLADGGRIGFDSGGDVEKRTKKITKAVNRYNKLLTDGLAKKDISKIPSFQGWFTKNYPDIPPATANKYINEEKVKDLYDYFSETAEIPVAIAFLEAVGIQYESKND